MKKHKIYVTLLLALAAALLVSLCLPPVGFAGDEPKAGDKPEAKGPTLYQRLGGANAIAVFMDDLVERTYADPVLNANPRIKEAHKTYPKAAYKFQATNLACQAFGGKEVYTGRTHKQAHEHLKITEEEWAQFMVILKDCLNSFKIPEQEQKEVIAVCEGTKGECVFPPTKK